jgi:hypothetical protein
MHDIKYGKHTLSLIWELLTERLPHEEKSRARAEVDTMLYGWGLGNAQLANLHDMLSAVIVAIAKTNGVKKNLKLPNAPRPGEKKKKQIKPKTVEQFFAAIL